MDVHDTCFPSVARLAQATSLNERTIQRVIKAARLAGWLSCDGTDGMRRTFRVDWLKLSEAKDVRSSRRGRPSVTGDAQSPVTGSHPTPDSESPGGVTESPERVTESHPKRGHSNQTSEATITRAREPAPPPAPEPASQSTAEQTAKPTPKSYVLPTPPANDVLDLVALFGDHPRRDHMVRAIAEHLRPLSPTVENLARVVASNPKGWHYRSRLTAPEAVYAVEALGSRVAAPTAPEAVTDDERRLYGRVTRALREGRMLDGYTETERKRIYAGLAACGGREAVAAKMRWTSPPDLMPAFVSAYRAAAAAGL